MVKCHHLRSLTLVLRRDRGCLCAHATCGITEAQTLLGNEKNIVTIRVKDGTPEGVESLCRTCTRGHIIRGFSASEEEVYCRTFLRAREIRFPVRECTFYEDRRIASKEDMEEIAWFLTTRKAGRSVGFISAAQFRELKESEQGAESTPDEPKLNKDLKSNE